MHISFKEISWRSSLPWLLILVILSREIILDRRTGKENPGETEVNTFYLAPKTFGAKCDGISDDHEALQAWIDALLVQGRPGILVGHCLSGGALSIDFSLASSILGGTPFALRGAGYFLSIISFKPNVSHPMRFIGKATHPAFGWSVEEISVTGNSPGPLIEIGGSDLSDEHNGITWKVWSSNYSTAPEATALTVNAVFNSKFSVVVNGGGSKTGLAAAQFNYVGFSEISGSFGHSATGIKIGGFYNFGNVFLASDIEVVDDCIKIDSPYAARNTFIGGTCVADSAEIVATAGEDNQFINMNWAASNPPRGHEGKGILIR